VSHLLLTHKIGLLTLSSHVRDGYSSQSVCRFVCVQQISKVTALQQLKRAKMWRRWWFKSL